MRGTVKTALLQLECLCSAPPRVVQRQERSEPVIHAARMGGQTVPELWQVQRALLFTSDLRTPSPSVGLLTTVFVLSE